MLLFYLDVCSPHSSDTFQTRIVADMTAEWNIDIMRPQTYLPLSAKAFPGSASHYPSERSDPR